jgi:hypothetical protein
VVLTLVSRWDPPLFGRGEERHPNSPELCSDWLLLGVLWVLWWPVAEDSDAAAGWWWLFLVLVLEEFPDADAVGPDGKGAGPNPNQFRYRHRAPETAAMSLGWSKGN